MPNVINQMLARELSESFEGVEGMLIVSLNGLTMKENEDLRNDLAEKGVRLRMVKNRIAQRALAQRGIDVPREMFEGNVGMAWGGPEEAIQAAKIVKDSPMSKEGKLAFRGGLLEGNVLDAGEAAGMADLPGPEELKSMMVGAIASNLRGVVGVLNAPGSALVRVLQAHIDKEDGAA